MAIKIENLSSTKLSARTQQHLHSLFESLPREHLRGIEKVRLVDSINDARIKSIAQSSKLPGLYHPRQGTQQAWLEVALDVLLPRSQPFYRQLLPRLSFKGNLAAVLFSLVGQHYYLTLRHSIKRGQIETAVRSYTEKHLKAWSQRQNHLRTRLFKPLQPTLEKWSRALQKRASAERKRSPDKLNAKS
ncbi:MAG: hypothetical protein ABR577_06695 [Pyrinomonadaceae bacterium]